jgi:uncharacterized membrane protein YdbT with pleckstrin-like domain
MPLKKSTKEAPAVVAAAALLATSAIATAAADALKTLNVAAAVSAKVVSETASKALAEFPRLQDDIREIRAAQQSEAGNTVSMVRDLLQAHTSAEEVQLQSLVTTVKAVEGHMIKQNGRLDKAETHITRQNVAIFGIAGPVLLVILGIVGRQFITMVIAAEKSGAFIDWPNLVLLVLGIVAVLVAVAVYFGYKVTQLLHRHIDVEHPTLPKP